MMQVSEIHALLSSVENIVETFCGVFAQEAVVALCAREVEEKMPDIFKDGSSVNYMFTHFENHVIALIEKKKMR